jgi:hypothetical protein
MTRKSKKNLLQQIMDEVANNYDYSQTLDIPIEELTGVEDQMPSGGIRSLPEMAKKYVYIPTRIVIVENAGIKETNHILLLGTDFIR